MTVLTKHTGRKVEKRTGPNPADVLTARGKKHLLERTWCVESDGSTSWTGGSVVPFSVGWTVAGCSCAVGWQSPTEPEQ